MSGNPLTRLSQFALNLRWLAAQVSAVSSGWARVIAKRCSPTISDYRANALIEGEKPHDYEISAIIDAFNVEEDSFLTAPLYGSPPDTVLNLNLRHLINAVPKGGKRAMLAKDLGITASTLSRWGRGLVIPERKNLRALLRHFGESEQIDLEVAPLFLALTPVGEVRKRNWLINQITNLPTTELMQVFPAAERIFSSRENLGP